MRIALYLLLVLFLASCGNQKMRYVRTKFETKTVHSEQSTSRNVINESQDDAVDQLPVQNNEESIVADTMPMESDITPDDMPMIYQLTPPDTLLQAQELDPEAIADEALMAEKNAKRALGWFIGTFVGYFLFIFAGMIAFVLGLRRYIQAKRARYITEKGMRILRAATVFFIIDLVFFIAAIVAITAFFIFIF